MGLFFAGSESTQQNIPKRMCPRYFDSHVVALLQDISSFTRMAWQIDVNAIKPPLVQVDDTYIACSCSADRAYRAGWEGLMLSLAY